jgi:hypothetical protein
MDQEVRQNRSHISTPPINDADKDDEARELAAKANGHVWPEWFALFGISEALRCEGEVGAPPPGSFCEAKPTPPVNGPGVEPGPCCLVIGLQTEKDSMAEGGGFEPPVPLEPP